MKTIKNKFKKEIALIKQVEALTCEVSDYFFLCNDLNIAPIFEIENIGSYLCPLYGNEYYYDCTIYVLGHEYYAPPIMMRDLTIRGSDLIHLINAGHTKNNFVSWDLQTIRDIITTYSFETLHNLDISYR